MSEAFEVDPAEPDLAADTLGAAARALMEGLLVVLPTETVYGLAARPDDPEATRRLFDAKRRPVGLNLPVLAAGAESAWELGVPNEAARRLAAAFWPGPLTLVLQRTERTRSYWLGERVESVGVRVPDHALSLALLRRSGPLAATSANLSGLPAIGDPAEIVRTFGEAVAVYLLAPAGARHPAGEPSSVVDLTSKPMRLLREGAIEARRLLEAAR